MKSEKHKKHELTDEETEEEVKGDFEEGDKDPDVYTEEGAEYLSEEDDSLEDDEEGFMKGEIKASEDETPDDLESAGVCDHCGKILGETFVEEEVNDEIHEFCCDFCASEFKKVLDQVDIADHAKSFRKESSSQGNLKKKRKK